MFVYICNRVGLQMYVDIIDLLVGVCEFTYVNRLFVILQSSAEVTKKVVKTTFGTKMVTESEYV